MKVNVIVTCASVVSSKVWDLDIPNVAVVE